MPEKAALQKNFSALGIPVEISDQYLIFEINGFVGKFRAIGKVFREHLGRPLAVFLALAFAKINGRPLYNTVGFFVKFVTAPKFLVFHKEAGSLNSNAKLKDAELKANAPAAAPVTAANTQDNLKQVQELLRKTAAEEKEVAGRM